MIAPIGKASAAPRFGDCTRRAALSYWICVWQDEAIFGKARSAVESGEVGFGSLGIPLANWYDRGSGSDLALCRQLLPSRPGRYRSLYRTVIRTRPLPLPVPYRYPNSPAVPLG